MEKAALNVAVAAAGAPEDCHLKWARTKWETGRAAGGFEEKKVQSEEKGSFAVGVQWKVWDRRLTSGLQDGSPDLSAAGRSAALRGGALPETVPG